MQITIVYGSSAGATQNVAEQIAENLSSHEIKLIDVSRAKIEDLQEAQILILGTSTWGDGDLQDDWDDFSSNLDSIDFSDKKVAFFGLGDQESYYDTFADGMGILYEKVSQKGANIIGNGVNGDSFDFGSSRAFIDGKFVGLVVDEDNQSNLSTTRISEWTKLLESQL